MAWNLFPNRIRKPTRRNGCSWVGRAAWQPDPQRVWRADDKRRRSPTDRSDAVRHKALHLRKLCADRRGRQRLIDKRCRSDANLCGPQRLTAKRVADDPSVRSLHANSNLARHRSEETGTEKARLRRGMRDRIPKAKVDRSNLAFHQLMSSVPVSSGSSRQGRAW